MDKKCKLTENASTDLSYKKCFFFKLLFWTLVDKPWTKNNIPKTFGRCGPPWQSPRLCETGNTISRAENTGRKWAQNKHFSGVWPEQGGDCGDAGATVSSQPAPGGPRLPGTLREARR